MRVGSYSLSKQGVFLLVDTKQNTAWMTTTTNKTAFVFPGQGWRFPVIKQTGDGITANVLLHTLAQPLLITLTVYVLAALTLKQRVLTS